MTSSYPTFTCTISHIIKPERKITHDLQSLTLQTRLFFMVKFIITTEIKGLCPRSCHCSVEGAVREERGRRERGKMEGPAGMEGGRERGKSKRGSDGMYDGGGGACRNEGMEGGRQGGNGGRVEEEGVTECTTGRERGGGKLPALRSPFNAMDI